VTACSHGERVDGVCTACGHCFHDVILNGVCLGCGATDLVIDHKRAPPELIPSDRLRKR
jgi:hypothetical protein